AYTDPESDRVFIGNPYLTDTEILNLDARWEWYFGRQQFVTAGVFYKKLDKPVEAVIVDVGNQRQQTFLNAPEATVMGVEAEVKKYFEFADQPSFISNKRWLVQANYTWSDSDVSVGEGDTVITLRGGGRPEQAAFYIQDGSRRQGQCEHVANLQRGWEDDTARCQAHRRLAYLAVVYRQDFPVKGRDLGVALELRNLLGTEFEEYQEKGNRIRIHQYALRQSPSVSLTARF